MIETTQYNAINKPSEIQKNKIVDFLFTHLGEYGDPKKDILKAIEFAIKSFVSFGGFVLIVEEENEIKGAVVINQTGMGGYIPENILVYIAVHDTMRGKGIGKLLMSKAIEYTQGDIALHVEANNPAKKLYEKMGFTNPYLEMRLKK